jgi:hypothetical protein
MADTKISDLTALTGANIAQTADVIPIVDTDATTTKKVLVSELAKAIEVLATEQASTSGTSIDFTSIPAWVKRITIMLKGVSTNGISPILLQIGDSGGIENSGYLGAVAQHVNSSSPTITNPTTGFGVTGAIAAGLSAHGKIEVVLQDSSEFTWVSSTNIGMEGAAQCHSGGGSKSLSAALDRVSITTVNGTDTFDAGAINILYE